MVGAGMEGSLAFVQSCCKADLPFSYHAKFSAIHIDGSRLDRLDVQAQIDNQLHELAC